MGCRVSLPPTAQSASNMAAAQHKMADRTKIPLAYPICLGARHMLAVVNVDAPLSQFGYFVKTTAPIHSGTGKRIPSTHPQRFRIPGTHGRYKNPAFFRPFAATPQSTAPINMTTDAVQESFSPESMPASPTPDDIIAAFLERRDDMVMYGQSQEYHSVLEHSFPSFSLDENTNGQQEHLFTRNNTFTNALLSPPLRSLVGFQQDFQLPSPAQSRSASPSGSDETAPRHRRTSSYPRKTSRNGWTHVRRHTTMGASSKGHMAHAPMVPRKAEDWEPWKNVMHQLYIVQNHFLKDIIVLMENTYHFKATPEMYKNQFARWNFFKYAIKRRSLSAIDTCSGSDSPESTEEPWMVHQDHQPEEMQAGTPVFRNDCDNPIDVYPSYYLDDSPSASQEPSYRFPSPQEELVPCFLDSPPSSLAQQMIMNNPDGKDLAARWSRGDFGPDFAQRVQGLYNKAKAMSDSGQASGQVSKAIQSIYCGWMSDYYESTLQWSEVFEWKKRGLSMTSNQQYVACSMRLEELMRDYGSSEEAEQLRRARMNIGWLMSGVLPGLFEGLSAESTRF